MSYLTNKIDFAAIVSVTKANPNGDPLNGNRPREDFDGFGEISDVCIKRKIRNRLQDMGEKVFVQSQDRSDDGATSLKQRADNNDLLKEALENNDSALIADVACKTWIDVRSFGQVFAFSGKKGSGKKDSKTDSVSVGVRGPVSIQTAVSVDPVDITTMQITKSVMSETKSDTMGSKHRVEFGVYVIKGSINHQLAQKTGFTDADADKIKEALITLFENDSSSARPEGSMEVKKVIWWKHNCAMGQYSSARVHRSLKITSLVDSPKKYEDYKVEIMPLEGLEPEVIDKQ